MCVFCYCLHHNIQFDIHAYITYTHIEMLLILPFHSYCMLFKILFFAASNMFLLLKFALLMCLVVGALMFLYILIKRIKIEMYFHVPSPAPFFQPLFTDYKGSLKNWLASEGTLMSIHKIEEPQAADTLIIEDNTIQEDQHLCATTKTQLQEPSPYVGHSVMDCLSPVTTVGSCSTLRFSFEGNGPSSTYNTTATSKCDSGCKDLVISASQIPFGESHLSPRVCL